MIFVTSNRNKFEEAKVIADDYDIQLEHRDMAYDEIQADTLKEVVKPSAEQTCKEIGAPCFVEDAGLFVDTLGGFPGPYSSYVFKTFGNERILKVMEDLEERDASFKSAVGYCEPGSDPMVFEGEVKGRITREGRGSKGFGFDPIFAPLKGDGRTFAQMTAEEKNDFSHRAEAIKKFVKWHVRNNKADGE